MYEQNIVADMSRRSGYKEIGDAIWLRPESRRITIGEVSLPGVKSPTNDGIKVFDLDDYTKKKKQFEKGEISRFERAMAGWSDEFAPKQQSIIEAEYNAKKEGKSLLSVAGLIEPTAFANVKTTQRVVAVFTKIEEFHELLSTIRVLNIDDLNGVAIYDINSLDVDPIQRAGTHNLPYEVSAPGITKTTLEPYKYAWRVAFSNELALVNFDLPNLEDLVLQQITGKLDVRRNKDVAAKFNATGNVGTQANWTTLNTGETRYANNAYDDVKELLNLLYAEGYGQAQYVGMHPDVWDAFYRNISATTPTGLQPFTMRPVDYNNSFREANALFPGVQFVVDTLFTTNRIYTWRADAIFHIFGGVRAVNFENNEIGYRGTTFRTYFNTATQRATLLKGGTGIIA
ncbi:MAG TPA: hypothetical protein VL854_01440 [Nitrososphaeraceae archaeon]|nr:hypothetical protein [Nitrososphaeraceae archaeon]